ncbi:cupredoxin domain-containing protein [Hyphomicrobium methylovorum]|uniref:cupredoxin domain-containing protein n=1 Tax=Hyphomicrobium methylovorum TaxID=84 RepID=UPI0015E6A39E|nr:cupredoxin domain-containing protein [Hyphomicrobium methylovorum]MBA2126431.1 cupredoxin domain-containing protein [Hyphomicrobium methylovorum]
MSSHSFVHVASALRGAFLAVCALVFAASSGFLLSSSAQASDEETFEISIKDHKFEPSKLTFPAGKRIKLIVKNLDPTPEEFESNDLNIEKIIPGNTEAIIRIKPIDPGVYIFFGEFNEATAKGHIIVE